jgi:hypothetical protein
MSIGAKVIMSNKLALKEKIEQAKKLMRDAGIGDLPLEAVAQLYRNRVKFSDLGAGGFELIVKNDWQGNLKVVDKILEDFRFSYSSGLARYVKITSTEELLRLVKRLHFTMLAGRAAVECGVGTRS